MELDEKRLARRGDPHTSLSAARKAAKAGRAATCAVIMVMADGISRIDEEIWWACRAGGYISSLDVIRHARFALSEAGCVEETGQTRRTKDNAPSREWRMTSRINNVRITFKKRKKRKRRKVVQEQ